ncbi:ABC transporter ATP-binding protein [Clostridium tagluense]|uniref:ABC transporter ATP-binding protein n=1 Tax=Clostridium tagluense TaxID=360422 RepID=UPI001CF31673|nr:ABC transporter ATP-binding protein [Clostridium tagluense]MCB2300039.1 ABC transporter ATP-binding protein [Clostridium tagluense]
MELLIDNLTKSFKDDIAVDQFSVKLTNGIYGLLGATGAGKTTLMKLICTLQKPTSGTIKYNEKEIFESTESYCEALGYLPQNFGYYPNFTALEFLEYISLVKGLSLNEAKKRSLYLLKAVNLEDKKNKKIKKLSGGMKQRLGIAQALINDPQILILDEPTAGLDPKERASFRNLISSMAKNKIIILSSHIVSDIEHIADEILIMKSGRLIKKGKPNEITKTIDKFIWECETTIGKAKYITDKFYVIDMKQTDNETVNLRIISEIKPVESSVQVKPTLEDLYLYYFAEEKMK